jgi:hypothetical protein
MASSLRAEMFASLGAQNWGTDKVDSELAIIFSGLSIDSVGGSSGKLKKKKEVLEDDRSLMTPSPTPASTGKENKIKIGLGKIKNKRQKIVLKPSSLETVEEEE